MEIQAVIEAWHDHGCFDVRLEIEKDEEGEYVTIRPIDDGESQEEFRITTEKDNLLGAIQYLFQENELYGEVDGSE